MATSKQPQQLWVRIGSAFLGIALVFALRSYAGTFGLQLLCFVAVVLGTRELIPILFHEEDSLLLKTLFYVLNVLIFAISTKNIQFSGFIFASASILFFCLSLLRRKRFENLNGLSEFQSKSILGFLYVGLLPSFAAQIANLRDGDIWFIGFLAIILAGDTAAFFVGRTFGKTKLMPDISPKKTRAGLWGGLAGSLVMSGFVATQLSSVIPMSWILALGTVCGLIGQMGDLFESTLKRVAQVKDSGTVMPGHGGVLDRIDGILFAAPFFFAGAFFIENLARGS